MLRPWPVLLFLPLAACGLPNDPDGTSKRIVSSHELRVGVTDNAPWANARAGKPHGVEPDLVRAFAATLGARVVWSYGSEAKLAEALKSHELDLAIGGFEAKTPWKSLAGVSQPFAKTPDKKKHVMLAPPGENGLILTLDKFLTEHLLAPKGASA
ncbi:MAG TPA: transporter substrate-binding domain-containing protein [Sphingomicrobium sp.]